MASAGHNQPDMPAQNILERVSLDAHALLILAPEKPLGTGWLGGDRVVGRAAVGDLLIKARRFSESERLRLTLDLPSTRLTLVWADIEKLSS